MSRSAIALVTLLAMASSGVAADPGNRLAYLNSPCDPYYVGLHSPKLITPQWVGEEGVDLVIVLAIDDMHDPGPYEAYLRPILERLKKIDGRAPVSIMTQAVDPNDPRLQTFLKDGVSIETHTFTHPCPCLGGSSLAKAKDTFDRSVDLLSTIPNSRPVAFRMPCCDSMNSESPRFFVEIFNRTTPAGRFLSVDSSVFLVFTANDPSLPRELVQDPDLRQRFAKYIPTERKFTNYIEDYPYPYVIANRCWEMPSAIPDDWLGSNLQKPANPATIRDMKAAIDATAIKQGQFTLTFHPHGWIRNDQVIDLIDHAVGKYGKRVKFLNLREVYERLTKNMLGGVPLRAANGQDNGVRVLDVNNDGYMDVVIGNEKVRQTRLWSPQQKRWIVQDFPTEFVILDPGGGRLDAGVQFGVLQENSYASVLVQSEWATGLWHFDGTKWVADSQGRSCPDPGGAIATSRDGKDRGVRLVDLDLDGVCELIIGNEKQQAVFRWLADRHAWEKLPFTLPGGATIVDSEGRDAGCRLVDIDEDGHPDVVFSNGERYLLNLFVSMKDGWSRKILAGKRSEADEIPAIVRADGTNNGVWFNHRHLWVQNENTGSDVEINGVKTRIPSDSRWYTALLDGDIHPPPRSPEDSLRSFLPRPGMKIELAAAEPLVMDPIDIAWGPDGKAWVVEMTDYPLGLDDKGKIGGRVRFLEDTDGDGKYDKSTVFLEPIGYPTGIMPWRKGVIVTTAPEVFYAEDTDGDGKADLRKALFTGFREGNQQHRVNHPRWGLDNWVYLANGDSGGEIKSSRTGDVLDISGRDLRIRPDEGLLDAETGQTQYGRNRDDWNNWFGCNNNNPGWYYTVIDHYIRRNPHVAAPPGHVDLTDLRDTFSGGRVITHCFIPQPTPPEGKPGSWTCLCGVHVYRDNLLGPEFAGNVFAVDAVYNTVHRMIVELNGVVFRGHRPPDELRTEFLCSADPWFRPTTVHTGPDGALWVVDMYRHVIEHPEWIDAKLVKTLDLREGHDKGRIYRIYPDNTKPRAIPRLDKLDIAGLVAALDSPNGWQRDMAHQLLIWRADKSAVKPLEEMAVSAKRPLARLHALCALDGLDALRPEIAVRAIADEHPGVRRHAVRVSERLVNPHPAVGEALLRRIDDPDPQVVMQLAYSLGEWRDRRSGQALGKLALRYAEDPYLSAAVMSSAVPHVAAILSEVRADNSGNRAKTELIGKLEKLAAAIKQQPELTEPQTSGKTSLAALRRPAEPNRQRIERVMGRAATVAEVEKTVQKYSPVLNLFGDPVRGRKVFVEATCSTCHRFKDLGEEIGPNLATLVDRSPQTLLVAVCDPNRAVLERFVEYIAVTKDGLQQPGMLLEESSNSITIVDRDAKRHVILRKDLEELIYTGLSHMPEGLPAKMSLQDMADLFAFVGEKGPPPRQFPGNRPELVRLAEDLSLHLLPANAEIYGTDIAFDAERRALVNWTSPAARADWNLRIEREGAFEVVLQCACPDASAGNRFVLQVGGQKLSAKVVGTGGEVRRTTLGQVNLGPGLTRVSLQPEAPLNGALMELRSLTLARPGSARKIFDGNAPWKIESDASNSLVLPAARAEVYGPSLAFEAKYQNLGMWLSPEDHAAWAIGFAKAGVYDVWLDWACQEGTHGNELQLQVKDQVVKVKVASTGTWDEYRQAKAGQIRLDAGDHRLIARPSPALRNALIDLRTIRLIPAGTEPK